MSRKRLLRLCRELGILVKVRARRAKRREVRGQIEVHQEDSPHLSHMPCSSQQRNRRQQVQGLGYFSGRSA